MKKLTYAIAIFMLLLNLLFIPHLITSYKVNKQVNELLQGIDDHTAYFYNEDTETSKDNDINQKALDNMPYVANTEQLNLYSSPKLTCILGICKDQGDEYTTLDIPIVFTDNNEQLSLPILSGSSTTKGGQIIISSSLASHFGFTPENIIGEELSGYEIVGVYDDPNPYSETLGTILGPYFLSDSPYAETNNQAYTSDSNLKSESQSIWFTNNPETWNEEKLEQNLIKITFTDDNLETNIENLKKLFPPNTITFISNLGIDESNTIEFANDTSLVFKSTVMSLAIIDTITLFVLVTTRNRK